MSLDLKQSLLLCDRLAIPSVEHWLTYADPPAVWSGGPDEWRQRVAEIEWLLANGLLVDPCPGDAATAWQDRLFAEADSEVLSDGAIFWSAGAIARATAGMLRREQRWNAVPLILDEDFSIPSDHAATRSDVVHIVLNELRLPGSEHSFEEIVGFREEARSQGLLQSLRVWMNGMASGMLSPFEVSDALADLSSRYERALTMEKLRRSTGIVETVVVTTAEVAESLVKFQWSTLARKLFEVRHTQIDLMKAEMTLPGREVAYIVKARERFGPR